MLRLNGNKVYVETKMFEFSEKILEAKFTDESLLVIFNPDSEKESTNNLYCFSKNGELLWRIKEPPKEIAGIAQIAYVGFSENDTVVDFYGRRFKYNVLNGEILGMDIVK